MKRWMISMLCCLLIASMPLMAQTIEDEKPQKPKEEKTAEQPQPQDGKYGTFISRELPDWSIKREVKTIERSLENYEPLIQSLEEANKELKDDLTNYLKLKPEDPSMPVLAAKITAKMSGYATKIVANMDKIITEQDVLLAEFNELNRKLGKFSGYLQFKAQDLQKEVAKYETREKELRKELKALSKKIKESNDPVAKEKHTQEFQRLFTQFNLNTRYKEGIARNQRDYDVLAKNLGSLVKMFDILHRAFASLIENLEAEKKYLLDNIRLQKDAIRVQKLVQEGISDGSKAVVKITQKLALLYAQVEGFSKVHEKINRDMAKFSDSTKILGSLVNEIEKAPFKSAPTLDKAIDYFYTAED